MFEHSQLVEVTWPWAYQALCFSSGYFAYDQLDMLIYRLYSGWIPSILVHHLVLLVCFTLALYRKVTINYLILTLICEVKYHFFHYKSYACLLELVNVFEWFAKAILIVIYIHSKTREIGNGSSLVRCIKLKYKLVNCASILCSLFFYLVFYRYALHAINPAEYCWAFFQGLVLSVVLFMSPWK